MLRIDEYLIAAQRQEKSDFVSRYPHPILLQAAEEKLQDDSWSFKTQTVQGPRTALLDLSDEALRHAKELERYAVYPVLKAEGSPWQERISIGRARNNDIVILDNSVSKLHAHFSPQPDGSMQVSDAGSRNGTKLNDRKLDVGDGSPIHSKDTLSLGRICLTYLCPEDFYELLYGRLSV